MGGLINADHQIQSGLYSQVSFISPRQKPSETTHPELRGELKLCLAWSQGVCVEQNSVTISPGSSGCCPVSEDKRVERKGGEATGLGA